MPLLEPHRYQGTGAAPPPQSPDKLYRTIRDVADDQGLAKMLPSENGVYRQQGKAPDVGIKPRKHAFAGKRLRTEPPNADWQVIRERAYEGRNA